MRLARFALKGCPNNKGQENTFFIDKWRNRNINYFTTGQKIISVYFLLSRSLRTMFEGLNLEILIL